MSAPIVPTRPGSVQKVEARILRRGMVAADVRGQVELLGRQAGDGEPAVGIVRHRLWSRRVTSIGAEVSQLANTPQAAGNIQVQLGWPQLGPGSGFVRREAVSQRISEIHETESHLERIV